ncbi:helix-turn-helix domain-containing protein [Rasiella sp. SM2506]|uniref:helix-turn-helix domain-containing protein n=1 Tax=Rasiella sp. SM2506 TaxID=3423914 RepID=UPI003D799E87
MNLVFKEPIDNSHLTLTDFSCAEGRGLLNGHEFYKIIWAKEEVNSILIDGCAYTFGKNQLIFCTPLNTIEMSHEHNALISIVFNREFYCIRDNDEEVSCNGLLFYGSSSPMVIMLDDTEKKLFKEIYTIVEEELLKENRSQGEMLRVMLKRLIIKSTRLIETKFGAPEGTLDRKETIRAFNVLVEKNFRTHHKVTDYATLLKKSPKTVSNVFSEYSDTTPLQHINERIILEAKRLLLYSNNSIKDISKIIGYNNASHFSNFFKKNVGISPLRFKKELQKN